MTDVQRVCLNVDVTDTLASGGWTGIQRVVRRLADELYEVGLERDVEVRTVAALNGRFHALNDAGVKRLRTPPREASAMTPPEASAVRRFAALLQPLPRVFLPLHAHFFHRRYARVVAPLIHPKPLSLGQTDLIFLVDPAWRGTTAVAASRRARSMGSQVVSLLYDMIPVDHPAMMTATIRTIFPPRLREMLAASDGAIAISHHCAARTRTFLGDELPNLPIRPIHLGNDLTGAAADGDDSDGEAGFLMIGTIEPRKGHATVLDAFDQLWAAGHESRLTLVGKLGWAHPDLIERCRAHPENGRRLRLIHDAGDARLLGLLSSAEAVIMASTVEGFGLPIVEALAADVPVIASDIPIFREIGGDALLYFAPQNADSLLAAIARLRKEPARWRATARAFTWPSWRDTAIAMLDAVGHIARERPER